MKALAFLVALGRAASGGPPRAPLRTLQELFASAGRDEVVLRLSGERWTMDGEALEARSAAADALASAFRQRLLSGAAFRLGVRSYEIAALAELLSPARGGVRGRDAGRFLRDRGVRRLRVEARDEAAASQPRPPAWLPHPLWRRPRAGRAGAPARLDLAATAHDLKAPLAAVCAALELVAGRLGPRLTPEESEFLEIGARNGQLMRRMINDIVAIDGSREDASPRPGRMDARTLLKSCAQCLSPWAKARGVRLSIVCGALVALARPGDALRILTNLASNAVKFTPAGGAVVLSAAPGGRDRPGRVVFTVRDSGPGIPREERERIFERFVQGAAKAEDGGSGLGLWIAKELVTRHGGELWVESEPGQGAAFRFTLPAA